MNPCKHLHFDGVIHTPCYQCENEQLRVENASLKAELAERNTLIARLHRELTIYREREKTMGWNQG